MNVSEVLNRAADLIEERGWAHGGGIGWEHAKDQLLCVEGALQVALGMHSGIAVTAVNTCPAGRALREYLGLGEFSWQASTIGLFTWNDNYAESAEQVIETLRAAALIAAASEVEARLPHPHTPRPTSAPPAVVNTAGAVVAS